MNTYAEYLRRELEAGKTGAEELLRELLLGKIDQQEYEGLLRKFESSGAAEVRIAVDLHNLLAGYCKKGLKSEHLEYLIGASGGSLPVIPEGYPGEGKPGFQVWIWIVDEDGNDVFRSSNPGPLEVKLPSDAVAREPLHSFLLEAAQRGDEFVYVPFDALKDVTLARDFRGETVIGDDLVQWLGRLDEGAAEDAEKKLGWIRPLKPEHIAQRLVFLSLVSCPYKQPDPIFGPIKVEEGLHIVWDVYLNWITGRKRGTPALVSWDQDLRYDPDLGRNRTAQDEIRDLKVTLLARLWSLAAENADREDFRRAGLNPDGSIPQGAVTYKVEYAWRDSRGRRHRGSWTAVQGTFSLGDAVKVVEGDRYRHLPEAERRARGLVALEVGARNTIYNLRLKTEASALATSGDVGKLVDHLGLWIREATSEDTILHRQAFIDAAWEKTAAESAHLASVAEVARAIQNYPTDSENFSHPDAVAAKLVAVGKVRPGTTAPQLVREAKRYLERGLADAKEESLGFLGKILPPRVARWLVSFLNKILSFLNVGIPLDKLEIFGRDAELGLLESFLAVDFGINVIARILWPLLVGLGICPQVIVVIGGCLLFGGIVGNLLKNNARDRVWVKVVVLAVCIVVFHDVLSGGHGLTSMVARPVGAAFEKWVEINPLISKPPTPTPFPTPFGPTPTPAILPEGWEI